MPTIQEFRALVVDQQDGKSVASMKQLSVSDLPEGDVLVSVAYSSLNYKDGLAVTGAGKVVRKFPIVPGIDLAGTVEASSSPAWKKGDQVIATGWGLGELHWGGYAQIARLKSEWLVRLPNGMTTEQAMAIGTAGFTAMMSLMALEEHGVAPGNAKPVVVTGAAGGLGSVAVALLSRLGYTVTASTGRAETQEFLKSLGAREVISREVLGTASPKPLEGERWSGAIDTVGGETLAGILRTMSYGGSVAVCGLAGGAGLPTTVLPFILRSVNLLGIDSVACPTPRRERAWRRLATELDTGRLASLSQVIGFDEISQYSREILKGHVRGRIVVDVNR